MDTKHLIGSQGGMTGKLNEETQDWVVDQDVTHILEEAKRDRENAQYNRKRDVGYKKAFTIPDIVAIELLSKYGLDVHSQNFMNDQDALKKLFYIIKTEYPHLMAY